MELNEDNDIILSQNRIYLANQRGNKSNKREKTELLEPAAMKVELLPNIALYFEIMLFRANYLEVKQNHDASPLYAYDL